MIRGEFPPRWTPHPFLEVAVALPGLSPDWSLVRFLVDSGAATTSIHPADAVRRLGLVPAALDPSSWNPTDIRLASGIGGGARYLEVTASFAFFDDEVGWIELHGTVQLSEFRHDNQHIPSLLGLDVLRHFTMTMNGKAQSLDFEWMG